jgi:hypothetical protein
MRLDVLPRSAANDAVNSLWVNSVLLCQGRSAHTSSMKMSDFLNLVCYENVRSASLASIIWNFPTALFVAVCCIVAAASNEKVFWSNAWWSIAIMADLLSFWDCTEMQFPRCNVSTDMFSASGDSTVTVRPIITANPKPTSIGFMDKLPESFFKWDSFAWRFIPARPVTVCSLGGDAYIENAIAI